MLQDQSRAKSLCHHCKIQQLKRCAVGDGVLLLSMVLVLSVVVLVFRLLII